MTGVSGFSRRTARALAIGGGLIFLLYAVLTIADGLCRSLLGTSLDIVRDTGGLVVAVAGACCLPLVVVDQEHIKLQVFGGIRSVQTLWAIRFFADVVVLVTLIGIAYQFVQFALKTQLAKEATWMLGIPNAPFYFVIAALLCLSVLLELVVLAEMFAGNGAGEVGP